ncbi:MAG TPA: hypothetical protein V6C64_14940 [Microcoleaceae cyanobacterium]|jgi:hypothetical protein
MMTKLSRVTYIRSAQMAIGLLAGLGVVFGSLSAAMADTATPQPLQDFQNPDKSSDPFSGRGGQSGVMDFIHRAMQGPSRSTEEFSAEQDENLDAAMAEFRAQQLSAIRKRQQAQFGTENTTPNAVPGNQTAPTPTTP